MDCPFQDVGPSLFHGRNAGTGALAYKVGLPRRSRGEQCYWSVRGVSEMEWEDRVVGPGLMGCLKVGGGDLVGLRGVVWEWIVDRGFYGG